MVRQALIEKMEINGIENIRVFDVALGSKNELLPFFELPVRDSCNRQTRNRSINVNKLTSKKVVSPELLLENRKHQKRDSCWL